MPVSGLYTIQIIEKETGAVTAEVRVDPAHRLFNGHFPGSPVLPGVVQIEMVKGALSGALGRELALTEMATCKFLEVFNPLVTPVMTLNLNIKYKDGDALDVTASGSQGGNTYFKLRASYR